MLETLKKLKLFLLLFIISFVTHRAWFSITNTIAYGDWIYRYSERLIEIPFSWTNWVGFDNLGGVNVMIYSYYYRLLTSLIPYLFNNFRIESINISILVPFALLLFYSPYIFLKEKKDIKEIFILVLYWASFLPLSDRSTTHMPIAICFALGPLLIYYINKLLIKKNYTNSIIIFFILQLNLSFDIRIFFISYFVFILYLILDYKVFYKNLKFLLFISFSLLITNLYIISTFIGVGNAIDSGVSPDTFAPHLFNITYSFLLQPYSWNGAGFDTYFTKQKPLLYLYIQPAILIYVIYLLNKYKFKLNRIELLNLKAGFILLLLGIFLTKQSGIPFINFYDFMFDHFPLFSLYREAGKFYFLTMLGYFLIFSTLIKYVSKSKFKNFILMLLLLISSINFYPLITKQIGQTYVSSKIDSELISLKDDLVLENKISRVLWLPFWPKTGYFSENHPRVNYYSIKGNWIDLLYENEDISEYIKDYYYSSTRNFLNSDKFKNLLLIYNINKVVVPNYYYSDNNLYNWPSLRKIGTRDYLIDILDSNLSLSKDGNYNSISVYDTNIQSSKIFYSNLDVNNLNNIESKIKFSNSFDKISSTIYKIKLETDYDYIYFSELYDTNWSISCKTSIFSLLNPFIKEDNCNYYHEDFYNINKFSISDINNTENIFIYNKGVIIFFYGVLLSMIYLSSLISYLIINKIIGIIKKDED